MKRLHIGLIILCVPMVNMMHQKVDRIRFAEYRQEERYFLPNPQTTKAISMGHQVMVSDFFWVRAVLIFADFAWDCEPKEARWLLSMIRTMANLDPTWRTLYFYGGTMMGVCDETEAADEVFTLGHQNIPDDYFFPFSLAMNAYLEHKDYESAEYWMRIAATKEGAPTWYRAAVAGVIDRRGQREASLLYLEEELNKELSPTVREITEERLRLLQHEMYVEKITTRKEAIELSTGQSIIDLGSLDITEPDPWGTGWVLSPDGFIRSVEMERRASKKTLNEERRLLKRRK